MELPEYCTAEFTPLNASVDEPLGMELYLPSPEQVEFACSGMTEQEASVGLEAVKERINKEIRQAEMRIDQLEFCSSELIQWSQYYSNEVSSSNKQ